jgi:hypothetical protein
MEFMLIDGEYHVMMNNEMTGIKVRISQEKISPNQKISIADCVLYNDEGEIGSMSGAQFKCVDGEWKVSYELSD